MKSIFGTAIAALTLASTVSATLPPIVVKGSKFFNSATGKEFFVQGVAYQADLTNATSDQQFVDPLGDPAGCTRDIPYLTAINTNAIRVYAVDTTKDHDDCMAQLDAAGIYAFIDLSQPSESINRDEPTWDVDLYKRYTDVIDMMQKYSNVIGFIAGNEVTNNMTNTDASPFVKAAVRDTKAYIKSKSYRAIPVGYATNDDSHIRDQMANYFNCGDQSAAVDFWGYNVYSWCGDVTIQQAGWDVRTQFYQNYSVPVFMAEYGCNTVQPRKFTEVAALFGPQMTPVWSGGLVYMYFQEANNYGLVEVSGSTVTKLVDYTYYQNEIKSVTPSGVQSASYTPTNTAARACPTLDAVWQANTALPPTPNDSLCSCAQQSFACIPASGLELSAYGDIFGYICGPDGIGADGCSGISVNGTTGQYGSYSACEASVRLGWAMNAYYNAKGANSQSCDFGGQAQIVTPTSLSSSCSAQISSAGGPSGTSSSGTGSGSGSGTSSTHNAAMGLQIPAFEFAILNAMLVALVSFAGGFGYFLL